MDNDFAEKLGLIMIVFIGTIGCIASVGLLLAFPIKWTWNATMPYIFVLPTITWGKAWCLHFLCGCLIKAAQTNKTKSKQAYNLAPVAVVKGDQIIRILGTKCVD